MSTGVRPHCYPVKDDPPGPVLSRLDCQTVLQPFGQVYHSPNDNCCSRMAQCCVAGVHHAVNAPPRPSDQRPARTAHPAQVALRPGSVGSRQENRRNLTLPMRPFCAQRVGIKPRCPEGTARFTTTARQSLGIAVPYWAGGGQPWLPKRLISLTHGPHRFSGLSKTHVQPGPHMRAGRSWILGRRRIEASLRAAPLSLWSATVAMLPCSSRPWMPCSPCFRGA